MKKYLTEQEIDNSLSDCIDLITQNLEHGKHPHIVSLYRGSLPLGVKLSNQLQVPLSIIDYQSYDGASKKPELIKNAGITADDLLILVDDICDKGDTLRVVEEYIRGWFPNNVLLIYTVVGSTKHPSHYNYSIEHENQWIVFPHELIKDTRCKSCAYSEPCNKNPETEAHCNKYDKSFKYKHTCEYFRDKIL